MTEAHLKIIHLLGIHEVGRNSYFEHLGALIGTLEGSCDLVHNEGKYRLYKRLFDLRCIEAESAIAIFQKRVADNSQHSTGADVVEEWKREISYLESITEIPIKKQEETRLLRVRQDVQLDVQQVA